MSKSSRPDRRRNDRRSKEPREFEETTLSIDRVTRVVGGGRRLRFRAVVITGNKKGKVGLGTGKATEVQTAVQKAAADAKRNMIRIPLKDGTIPHEVDFKFKAARIRLMPASEGTGVIAGGALRTVLEHAGVRDVLSKRYGTNTKLVNAQAVIKALSSLRGQPQDETEAETSNETESKEQLKVQEVSRKQVSKEGTLQGEKKESKKKKPSDSRAPAKEVKTKAEKADTKGTDAAKKMDADAK